MVKYHINPNSGNVRVCKATSLKTCPYAAEEGYFKGKHFDSKEEAFVFVEKSLSKNMYDKKLYGQKLTQAREDLNRRIETMISNCSTQEELIELTNTVLSMSQFSKGSDKLPAKMTLEILKNPLVTNKIIYRILSLPLSKYDSKFRAALSDPKNIDAAKYFLNSPHASLRTDVLKNPAINDEQVYNHIMAYPENYYANELVRRAVSLRATLKDYYPNVYWASNYQAYIVRDNSPYKNKESLLDQAKKMQSIVVQVKKIVDNTVVSGDIEKLDDQIIRCQREWERSGINDYKIPDEVFKRHILDKYIKTYMRYNAASEAVSQKQSNVSFSKVKRVTYTDQINTDAKKVSSHGIKSTNRKSLATYENSIELQDRWTKSFNDLPLDMKNDILNQNFASGRDGLYGIVGIFKTTNESGQQVSDGLNNFVHHINNLKEKQRRMGAIAIKNPSFMSPIGNIKIEGHEGNYDFGERIIFTINSSKFMMQKPPQSDVWKDFVHFDEGEKYSALISQLDRPDDGSKPNQEVVVKKGFWRRLFGM